MPAMHVLGMPVLHMPVVSRKPVLRGQLHTAALLRRHLAAVDVLERG